MSDGGLSDINIAFLFIVSVSVIGVLAVNFAFIDKMVMERKVKKDSLCRISSYSCTLLWIHLIFSNEINSKDGSYFVLL